jgi:hypothetical protein
MLNFLCIGAQKAGTTWLYEMLSLHTAISFPAGKEVHFWDAQQDKGIAWYNALFSNEKSGQCQGEITPAYAFLNVEEIKKIHAYYPRLRLIYMIRNPIERAWSSALMALGRAEMLIHEASDQWFIDHFYSQGSLQRGDYESCIRTWRQVYDFEQLLILRYENIIHSPRELLMYCCEHLGVESDSYLAMDESIFQRRVVPQGTRQTQDILRPSLRPVLEKIYREKIMRLSDYLEMDLSNWK